MPSAQQWRLVGVSARAGGDLTLSELQLYAGAARADAGATITSSHAPIAGALADLGDDDTATACTFAGADVRCAGFWVQWQLIATQEVTAVRPGAGAVRAAYLAGATLQYLQAGVWVTLQSFGQFQWPGAKTMDAAPAMSGDPNFSAVGLLLHGDGDAGSTAIVDSSMHAHAPASVPSGVTISADRADAFGGRAIKIAGSAPLQYAHHAAFTPQWDFTVDMRVSLPTVTGSTRVLLLKSISTGHRTYSLQVDPDGTVKATASDAAGSSVPINRNGDSKVVVGWNRIEFSRIGNNFRLFLNGVLQWVGVMAGANYVNTSHPVCIGGDSAANYPASSNGAVYVEEVRISSVGRNTSNYMPETEPFLGAGGGGGGGQAFDLFDMRAPAPEHLLVAASSPVPAHSAGAPAKPLTARDVEFGGAGRIWGSTKTRGTPASPTRARVVLLHQRSKLPVRETWSDAATGAFEFVGIDTRQQFLVLAEDAAGNFRPVAASRLSPEVSA